MSETKKKRKTSSSQPVESSLKGHRLLAGTPKHKTKKDRSIDLPQHEKKTEIDCFKEVRVDLAVHLPPAFIGSILLGVVQKLGANLMKYSPDVEGVILCFWNAKLLQRAANILFDHPHFHFKVTASLLVFAPQIGSRLVGVVHQIGFDHIALLIFGTLNVYIPCNLLPHFVRGVETDCWVRSPTNEVIQEGTKILFAVTAITKSIEAYSIVGSMAEEGTGIVVENESNKLILHQFENLEQLISKSDKRNMIRRSLSKENPQELHMESFSEISEIEYTVVKKEKASDDEEEEEADKKKKKRKRSSSSAKVVTPPPAPKKRKSKKE